MATKEISHKLTDDEIKTYADSEIETARQYNQLRSTARTESWDRYYGRKLGNEKTGRSKFITRDVMDTIEWMMPYFIRTFASGDPKIDIEIKGQESWVGKALMSRIQDDLANATPNLFTLFYQWFKDALVSDTAFVKTMWILDQKTVSLVFDDNIGPEHMQVLQDDPDVEITAGAADMDPAAGVIYSGVKAKVKQTIKDMLYAENTPHWEFMTIKDARDVNDDHPKGHKTKVSLDYLKRIDRAMRARNGKLYFKHLDELGTSGGSTDITDQEQVSYMGDDAVDTEADHPKSEEGAKARVDFLEWYTRLDVDGDGYLEDIVCFYGDDKMLRWELNDEDFIPWSAIKAIIDPYKFFGISFASMVIEIQNLNTMIFRRILDMFDFQTSGRWRVDPGANVDIHSLLNFAPGKSVFAKQGAIEDLSPQPFNPASLSILEYTSTLKENRTGITRYNQGTNASSLNKRIDIETPVPLADGTWKFLGEIEDGDKILSGDGQSTTVTKAHEVAFCNNAYGVEFRGSRKTDIWKIVADAEHLWGVYIGKHWNYRVLSTEEIRVLLESGERLSVPKPQRIDSGEKIDLPVDPYLFGAWLGDGSKWDTVITTIDKGIVKRVRESCDKEGWELKKDSHPQGMGYRISVRGKQKRSKNNGYFARDENCFYNKLDSLGVFRRTGGEPHIPAIYFRSSYKQRMDLLKGLMDTDGHWEKAGGMCYFGNSNYNLIEGTARLIKSLGGVPNIRKVRKKGKMLVNGKNCNTKAFWLVGFNLNESPFSLERKSELWRPTRKKAYRIVSIKKTEPRLMRCLTVDSHNGLWLVGENYIATHNTATGIVQIQTAAMQRLELIGRIFAETGIKDFYRKCVLLYQKHLSKPFIAKVFGQEREVTREMIQGEVVTRVNMGVEAVIGMQEAEKIVGMLDVLVKIDQMFPGLLGPEKIHNLAKRYVTSLGFKQADDFIADLQSFVQENQAMQKQKSDMEQRMMQMQEQMAQFKLKLEAADREIKSKQIEQDAKLETVKLSQDFQLEQGELKLKERDSSRDYEVGLLKILGDQMAANQARREMRVQR